MERVLKFKTSFDKNVFFTSDWHCFHRGPRGCTPLWQTRGCNSPEHMTDEIVSVVNKLVRPEDVLFNLGDFCLDTTRTQFEELLGRIQCQNVYYINGNHNSRVKDAYRETVQKEYGRDDIEVYPIRYRNVIFLGHYAEITVNSTFICLCHYPLASFNYGMNGAYMIHGHCHYNYLPSQENYTDARRLDVSWDGFHKPLSFEDIQRIMALKRYVPEDHHGK